MLEDLACVLACSRALECSRAFSSRSSPRGSSKTSLFHTHPASCPYEAPCPMAERGDLLDPEHMGRGRVVAEDKEEREMPPPPRSRQRHSPNQLHVSSRSQQASLYLTFQQPPRATKTPPSARARRRTRSSHGPRATHVPAPAREMLSAGRRDFGVTRRQNCSNPSTWGGRGEAPRPPAHTASSAAAVHTATVSAPDFTYRGSGRRLERLHAEGRGWWGGGRGRVHV